MGSQGPPPPPPLGMWGHWGALGDQEQELGGVTEPWVDGRWGTQGKAGTFPPRLPPPQGTPGTEGAPLYAPLKGRGSPPAGFMGAVRDLQPWGTWGGTLRQAGTLRTGGDIQPPEKSGTSPSPLIIPKGRWRHPPNPPGARGDPMGQTHPPHFRGRDWDRDLLPSGRWGRQGPPGQMGQAEHSNPWDGRRQ